MGMSDEGVIAIIVILTCLLVVVMLALYIVINCMLNNAKRKSSALLRYNHTITYENETAQEEHTM